MSAIAQIENKLNAAPNLKVALQENFVEERFIQNFQAVTGRKDGKEKFQSTFLSYMERIAEKPELVKANRFSHFAAIVKIGRMGLPLEKLYIMSDGNGGVKVQSDPAGKRAQLQMMEKVKRVLEPQFVLKGDKFVHDKLNNVVKVHETEHMGQNFTLDDIVCAYTRIEWKDGTMTDTVVYHQDLVKARAKSPAKSDQSFWATYPGEASKKVSINRTHRLYFEYPDNVLTFGDEDESDNSDNTSDAGYANVQEDFTATENASVAENAPQVAEEVPVEDFTAEKTKEKKKSEGESFI